MRKGKKTTAKNILQSKAFIQIWWRNQKFFRQTEAKSVQHQQTSFTRNVKGTFLSEKEKATTRNIRIMKGKSSSVKANIPVKLVNFPCTKLVGRLKDKSSKIIYTHNKLLRNTQNN